MLGHSQQLNHFVWNTIWRDSNGVAQAHSILTVVFKTITIIYCCSFRFFKWCIVNVLKVLRGWYRVGKKNEKPMKIEAEYGNDKIQNYSCSYFVEVQACLNRSTTFPISEWRGRNKSVSFWTMIKVVFLQLRLTAVADSCDCLLRLTVTSDSSGWQLWLSIASGSCGLQLCMAGMSGSNARKLCLFILYLASVSDSLFLAAVPGCCFWQECLAVVSGSCFRQQCLAVVSGNSAWQLFLVRVPETLYLIAGSPGWIVHRSKLQWTLDKVITHMPS